MKLFTLKIIFIDVIYVINDLYRRATWSNIREFTLVRNLMNVNVVIGDLQQKAI